MMTPQTRVGPLRATQWPLGPEQVRVGPQLLERRSSWPLSRAQSRLRPGPRCMRAQPQKLEKRVDARVPGRELRRIQSEWEV